MREDAYITSIPAAATEKVLTIYENRSAKHAEYYVEGRLIGIRTFHPTGEVEMGDDTKTASCTGIVIVSIIRANFFFQPSTSMVLNMEPPISGEGTAG